MGDWTPISIRNKVVEGTVVLAPRIGAAQIGVAADIVARFGEATHVIPMQSDQPGVIGLRGDKRRPGVHALQLIGRNARGTASAYLSAVSLLAAVGKGVTAERVILPHRWDGDILVIDLSGLPDATGGQ